MTPASAMHCRAGEPKSEHWWSLLLPTSVAATRKRPRSRLPPFEGLILHRIARHNTTDPRRPPELVVQAALADQPTRAFTHWQPANGAGLEIINWLDDHSRYLLAAIAAEGPTAEGATAEHDGRPGTTACATTEPTTTAKLLPTRRPACSTSASASNAQRLPPRHRRPDQRQPMTRLICRT